MYIKIRIANLTAIFHIITVELPIIFLIYTISQFLRRLSLLNYIYDFFWGVATSQTTADLHVSHHQQLWATLRLQEAQKKSPSPSQEMIWLGLKFNSIGMSVTLLQEKIDEVMTLVHNWVCKEVANIHDLCVLLKNLFYMVQCCPSAWIFINRMLDTLMRCPLQGVIHLSVEFQKDSACFQCFLPQTNGVFLIHEDARQPVILIMDACTPGCRH